MGSASSSSDERGWLACAGWAGSESSSSGRPFEPASEIMSQRSEGSSAQCRSSTTSSVGSARGEVRGQPVEAVQHRKRRLGAVSQTSSSARTRTAMRSAPPRPRATRRAPPGSLRPAAPRRADARSRTRILLPAHRRARSRPRNRPPRRARAPRREAWSFRFRRCPRRRQAGRRQTAPRRASPPAQPAPPRARARERARIVPVSAPATIANPPRVPVEGPERGGKPSGGLSRPTNGLRPARRSARSANRISV